MSFCLIIGLLPSQGNAALISIRDVVSNSSPQENSDHTVEFSSSYAIPINGEIVITPQSGKFLIPAGLNVLDIDVLVNGVNKSIGVPGNTTADMIVSIIPGTAGSIHIIPKKSTISARSKVIVIIGLNAAFGAPGMNQIKNPGGPGSFSLEVNTYDPSHSYIDGMDTIVVILPSIGVGAMILGENQIEAAPRITMNTTQKEVVINKNEGTHINVPSTVSDATIDVHHLITNLSGVLPSITMDATTRLGIVRVAIPQDTTINGPDGWTGVINMPTIKSNSSVSITPESGKTRVVQSVIEVGFNDLNLTFDKGVRLNIEGQAGNLVGFSRGGVFTKIDTTCIDDSQAAGDALGAGGNCKIYVGSDLVIWTKHFTSFATYTEETTVSNNSGGGGGGATYAPENFFTPTPTVVSPTETKPVSSVVQQEVPLSAEQTKHPTPTIISKKNLSQGATGAEVKALQQFLTDQGFPVPRIGIFGPQTKAALQKYQKSIGVASTGSFDVATRSYLERAAVPEKQGPASSSNESSTSLLRASKPLVQGATGAEVKALQQFLTDQGFPVPRIGIFGPQTKAALQKYQKSIGVAPTGSFDAATRSYLERAAAPEKQEPVAIPNDSSTPLLSVSKSLSKGATGTEVKALQQFLTDQGFSVPTIGIFGPQTKAALQKYQKSIGVAPTGSFDAATRSYLERAAAPEKPVSMVPNTVTNPPVPTVKKDSIFDNLIHKLFGNLWLIE